MATNEKDARDLRYHEYFHIEPARKQLSSGNLNWDVMNNLHFVLHKVPNDHSALALLVQWDKAGGRDKDVCVACLLPDVGAAVRAERPDGLAYGGYYFYHKNDVDRARQWWEEALVAGPANADVHYNLGLLMFEQGRYAEARTARRGGLCGRLPAAGLA